MTTTAAEKNTHSFTDHVSVELNACDAVRSLYSLCNLLHFFVFAHLFFLATIFLCHIFSDTQFLLWLHWVKFTLTNVPATLYAIVFWCSFFILNHVCVGCSWKNAWVFKTIFSQRISHSRLTAFVHRFHSKLISTPKFSNFNIFMDSFAVYSRHNFMFPQFYKVSYSSDNIFSTPYLRSGKKTFPFVLGNTYT